MSKIPLALPALTLIAMVQAQANVPLDLQILNLKSGQAIDYPLAFVYGKTTHAGSSISVNGIPWPIAGGQFKALVKLRPGRNSVVLNVAGDSAVFPLQYQPKTNTRFMRLVYFLGSDQYGDFEAPAGMPNKVEDAVARIRLAGLLMQTFYAETGARMAKTVLGQADAPLKTFRLELDSNEEPIVHVVTSKTHTAAQLRAMRSTASYPLAHDQIHAQLGGGTLKQAVIMGFSNKVYYEAQAANGDGSAWGGGSLDGSGDGGTTACNLYAWAPSLAEFMGAMTNTKAPEAGLCRDWNFGTYFQNYSLTVGGWFHEMGHTFGLGHTSAGIMSADIGVTFRFFLIQDPVNKQKVYAPDTEKPDLWWDRSQASMWAGAYFKVEPVSMRPYLARTRVGSDAGGASIAAGSWRLDGKRVGITVSPPKFSRLP